VTILVDRLGENQHFGGENSPLRDV